MDSAQQAVNGAAQIHEGASLAIAFKSQPGQLILEAVLSRLVEKMEHLILDPLKDDEVLRTYSEIKGMLGVFEDLGYSVKRASEAVMRNGVKSRLSVKLPPSKTLEDES